MRYGFGSVFASGVATIALVFAAGSGPAQAAIACANLTSLKIAASEIGLPTSGATITSAQTQTVPADPPRQQVATREYCKVLGAIAPVDPKAPPINFQVNLPAQWNGKAVQYGGGGSNGVLITGLNPLRDARRRYARAGCARLRRHGARIPAMRTRSSTGTRRSR